MTEPEWAVPAAEVEDTERRAVVIAIASVSVAAIAAVGLWVLYKRIGAKRVRRGRVHDLSTQALDLSTQALDAAREAGQTIAQSVAQAPAAVKERFAS